MALQRLFEKLTQLGAYVFKPSLQKDPIIPAEMEKWQRIDNCVLRLYYTHSGISLNDIIDHFSPSGVIGGIFDANHKRYLRRNIYPLDIKPQPEIEQAQFELFDRWMNDRCCSMCFLVGINDNGELEFEEVVEK